MAQKTGSRNAPRPHGDATGRAGRAQYEEMVEYEQERERELTQAREQQVVEESTQIIDVTGNTPSVVNVEDNDEDAETLALVNDLADSEDPKVKALLQHFVATKTREQQRRTTGMVDDGDGNVVIRVNADIDEMTFGKDPQTGRLRNFSFARGRQYRVPLALAQHLDRNNRIWH